MTVSGSDLYVSNLYGGLTGTGDPTGNGFGHIEEYPLTGGGNQKGATFATSGLFNPTALAVAGGTLYVANIGAYNGSSQTYASYIEQYSLSTGQDMGVFASVGLDDPLSMVVSGGMLYVGNDSSDGGPNKGLGYIQEYSLTTGNTLGAFSAGEPDGMALDGEVLYVANHGNSTIEEYSLAGTDLGLFADTGSFPISLAINIPEPTAGALFALGCVALLRRRRLHRH